MITTHPAVAQSVATVINAGRIDSGLLKPVEAAGYLRLAEKTLAKDRCTREIGVPYVKLGRSVFYRRADLERFINERVINALAT